MKTAKQFAEFENLERQLHVFMREMSALSTKKPDGPVNKFKLAHVNNTLSALNSLLDSDRPFPSFDTFSVEELPSNSDVVMILAQYVASVFAVRERMTRKDPASGAFHWVGDNKFVYRTDPPLAFKYKEVR